MRRWRSPRDVKRFSEHRGASLAATISYYSFFSVFPLMLAFVTILGIVLDDNPDLRDDLVEGALGQIPVIGSQIADVQNRSPAAPWCWCSASPPPSGRARPR